MTMPTVTKTYQISQGIYGSGSVLLDDARALHLGLKNILIGFGLAPWTVQGSSNSVAAGMDAVDRWSTASNLVWQSPGSAHSWIVLRQTGISATFELCVDLVPLSAAGGNATIVVSPNAFSGGSTTARPTAVNERVLINQTSFLVASSYIPNGMVVMQSTDGSVTRVLVMTKEGYISPYMAFEVPKNPVAGWTDPWLALTYTATANIGVPTSVTLSNTARYVGRVGTTDFTAFLGGEGYNGILLHKLNRQNSYTKNYPTSAISVLSETAGARGRLGELMDVWWVTTSNSDLTQISLWPDGVSRAFIQMGDMLFPWDGSWPNIYPA